MTPGKHALSALDELFCVTELVPSGDGFGRLRDGRPMFVTRAFPGDVVRLVQWDDRKQYLRATRWSLITASPQRRALPCPVAHQCGGCNWMALPKELQHHWKLDLVQQALKRTGKFHELPCDVVFVSAGNTSSFADSPTEWGFRQRVRLHLDRQHHRVGFYAAGSHEVVEAPECLVMTPAVQRAAGLLRAALKRQPAAFGVFSQVDVRAVEAPADFCEGSLCFGLRDEQRWTLDAVRAKAGGLLSELAEHYWVRVRGNGKPRPLDLGVQTGKLVPWSSLSWPGERLPLSDDLYLRAAPGDFTQTNWEVNRAIVAELTRGAAARGVATFADLYSGIGNFALPLLQQGLTGTLVESNASALRSAKVAAAEQGLGGAQFVCRDVTSFTQRRKAQASFDLVVVDPPRAGIGRGIETVASLASRWIFLCACDPVTFARDLKRLVELGFEIESLHAYDMFPQTHHVETTAWLCRNEPNHTQRTQSGVFR